MTISRHPKNEARSNNFLFIVGEDREMTFSIQASNIADVTLNRVPFPSGQKEIFISDNRVDNDPLVISYLISEDWSEWIYMYKWIMRCKNANAAHLTEAKVCTLIALDANNRKTVSWVYKDCMPSTLESVQFAIDDEGNKVITTTSTLFYNIMDVIDTDGNIITNDFGKAS